MDLVCQLAGDGDMDVNLVRRLKGLAVLSQENQIFTAINYSRTRSAFLRATFAM